MPCNYQFTTRENMQCHFGFRDGEVVCSQSMWKMRFASKMDTFFIDIRETSENTFYTGCYFFFKSGHLVGGVMTPAIFYS